MAGATIWAVQSGVDLYLDDGGRFDRGERQRLPIGEASRPRFVNGPQSHWLMTAMVTVASKRTASLSYRVAIARFCLSWLMPHSTA